MQRSAEGAKAILNKLNLERMVLKYQLAEIEIRINKQVELILMKKYS